MTTPAWNVRATDTALVLEHPDAALVAPGEADQVYEAVNGFPPPADPNPSPEPPAGLSNGMCLDLTVHDAHRATMAGDDGSEITFWCMGRTVAADTEPGSTPA